MAPDRAEGNAVSNKPPGWGTVPLLGVDHQGLDVLTREECEELLTQNEIGRVGFDDNGVTVILPVNYTFIAGSVLFRTAPGSKLDLASAGGRASFQIDDWDPRIRSGWSVLVKGRAESMTDAWFTTLAERFDVEPWADEIPREHWVRIEPDEMTGRWIHRLGDDDSG